MKPPPKGRGAAINPPNRFESLHLEPLELDVEDEDGRAVRTAFFRDSSRTILAKNDSPDVPFTYSLNPYRGCEHGCIYCYARPSHEYLGFSSGIDFESKILVKEDAPGLLAAEFRKKSWKPEWISLSGNTDCYQPVERKLRITRSCLDVFLKYRNPVGIITKNHLVTRDLDILEKLSRLNLASVSISVTTLDEELARRMEPRTSVPSRRLEAIKMLSSGGIPTSVMVAPVIPGLTDEEIPAILKEAAAHGATQAAYTLVRLPGPVLGLFTEWLQREFPEKAAKIMNRIKEVHGGDPSDSRFSKRMTGEGELAGAIKRLFDLSRQKYGLQKEKISLSVEEFGASRQLEIF